MSANLPERRSPDQRVDPDELLARMRREEARARRGRLKIFFGAAPGVGKSYAMLEAARKLAAEHVDIVVGYVELHGRADTERLLEGLEVLPPQRLDHRGVTLTEFDVDAALKRHPRVVCVDELAHSNHAGARHPKRWMDVEELLVAGIDVYTTVNVQHIESLNDVVAQITGVHVRETVPDRVFDAADEVELVDLPPDELLQRLREGKVYASEKTGQALTSFFRKGNLIALRELALRTTADRVDAALRAYREDHAIVETWAAGERVLVCIGPDPLSERVVRAARRLATALHAGWIAVYVETPALTRLPRAARDRVLANLKLAETLGAETANLSGESVAGELIAYARRRNVSKIILGKPSRPRWHDRLRPSLVDEIARQSGAIDVYVISGEAGEQTTQPRRMRRTSPWQAYARSAAVVGAITLLCELLYAYVELTNLVMLYLLGTVYVAARIGRGPSALVAVLSVCLFDFLFVPPIYSFAVSDAQYLITFGVMLATGLVISHFAARGKRQAAVARARERRTNELYALSRELAQSRNVDELGRIVIRHILADIDGEAAVLLPDAHGHLLDPAHFCTRGAATANATRYPVPGNDLGIAQWAYDHRQKAGRNTDTLASADAIYLPLNALKRCIGVIGLRPADPSRLDAPEQMQLIESFVNQAAVAMERVQLAETAQAAGVEIESEKMRNALLSSISHDFRTPLASIIGATSTLLDESPGGIDAAQRKTLLGAVFDEANRLHRLVDNLLDLTRLTAGKLALKRQWVPLEEIVGAVLHRLHAALVGRKISVDIPADLPLLHVDEVMLGQLLFNLVDNAQKYTPAGSAIEIAASVQRGEIVVSVRDHGPGVPPGEEERVFDKFQRGHAEGAQSGFGLGLSIAKAIVEAHGGEIRARNYSTDYGGGAEFRFSLPLAAQPPA